MCGTAPLRLWGAKVIVFAELLAVNDRRAEFRVEARLGEKIVGEGKLTQESHHRHRTLRREGEERRMRIACASVAALAILLLAAAAQEPDSFRFVVLGDRTGEAQPGVYERVWKDAAHTEGPAFVVSVGDTIQGLNDETADAEWQQAEKILSSWKRFSALSHARKTTTSGPRFRRNSFRNIRGTHRTTASTIARRISPFWTTSRSDQLSAAELTFLEENDLMAHNEQPLKFIVSHRPSWLLNAVVGDPNFRLHQIAKKYGAPVCDRRTHP